MGRLCAKNQFASYCLAGPGAALFLFYKSVYSTARHKHKSRQDVDKIITVIIHLTSIGRDIDVVTMDGIHRV